MNVNRKSEGSRPDNNGDAFTAFQAFQRPPFSGRNLSVISTRVAARTGSINGQPPAHLICGVCSGRDSTTCSSHGHGAGDSPSPAWRPTNGGRAGFGPGLTVNLTDMTHRHLPDTDTMVPVRVESGGRIYADGPDLPCDCAERRIAMRHCAACKSASKSGQMPCSTHRRDRRIMVVVGPGGELRQIQGGLTIAAGWLADDA